MIEQQDSVLGSLRNALAPLIGQKAADRTIISQINYNHPKKDEAILPEIGPPVQDTGPIQRFSAYSFECYVLLEDSIWFPFQVSTDSLGMVLSGDNLPRCLKDENAFQLLSMCEIWKVGAAAFALNSEVPRPHMTLHFSSNQNRFYYELESTSDKLLEESSNSSKSKVNHMFIDARTGEILLTLGIIHQHEWGGCVDKMSYEVPKNDLIDKRW